MNSNSHTHLKHKARRKLPISIAPKSQKKISPTQTVVLSFLIIILIGGILLSLPISQSGKTSVSFIDAFFTSVSAVCVTGLTTCTTATTWSVFGKIVILFLIQIGGLSLITIFASFMVYMGKKISLKNRLAIQTALNRHSIGGVVAFVILVIKGTLLFELLGAVFLSISFMKQGIVWYKSLFYGLFHSVSAFCNAGFDILGDNSLADYSNNFGVNIVVMLLITLGGIGFTVWAEIIKNIKARFSLPVKRRFSFSLHAKLVLLFSAFLVIFGTLFFLIAEYNNPETLGNFSFPHKLLGAFFQSVTLRTAGFATISQGGLTGISKLVSVIFMLIGGSPGGTAGGLKTVTLAIILCSVISIIHGHSKIVVFDRTIATSTLQKSLAVTFLMVSMLFIGIILLAITEPYNISDLVFEVSSALGTVGLSTGITPFLSAQGKLVLMLCMFAGRIGPLTLIISLSHDNYNSESIGFPKEDVIIG